MLWRTWFVQTSHFVVQTYSISLFPANSLFYAHSMRMVAAQYAIEAARALSRTIARSVALNNVVTTGGVRVCAQIPGAMYSLFPARVAALAGLAPERVRARVQSVPRPILPWLYLRVFDADVALGVTRLMPS